MGSRRCACYTVCAIFPPSWRGKSIKALRTEAEYQRALATLEALLEVVGDDEAHPLAEVLDYLADRVKSYEDARYVMEPYLIVRLKLLQYL